VKWVGRSSCVRFTVASTSEVGRPWPQDVPLQIVMMDADEWALPPNEDLDVARQLAKTIESAELFLYPGEGHLLADNSLPAYEESAATLLEQRVLGFLDHIELRYSPPDDPSVIPSATEFAAPHRVRGS
jgi:hypothetical protein